MKMFSKHRVSCSVPSSCSTPCRGQKCNWSLIGSETWWKLQLHFSFIVLPVLATRLCILHHHYKRNWWKKGTSWIPVLREFSHSKGRYLARVWQFLTGISFEGQLTIFSLSQSHEQDVFRHIFRAWSKINLLTAVIDRSNKSCKMFSTKKYFVSCVWFFTYYDNNLSSILATSLR